MLKLRRPSWKLDRVEAFDFIPSRSRHHAVMIGLVFPIVVAFASAFKSRRQLVLENVALRQQVSMLKRSVERPRVSVSDHLFWIAFARYAEDRR
jgi:hypothetical protein